MNKSGIIFSASHNRNDESNHEKDSENNGKSGSTYNAGKICLSEFFNENSQFPTINDSLFQIGVFKNLSSSSCCSTLLSATLLHNPSVTHL